MQNKKHTSVRLSELAQQALAHYMKKWELSRNVALEHLLIRWRYLDDMGFREQASPELECFKRIKHTDGLFYCVHRPPKMIRLETLQICVVCRKRKLGIAACPENTAEMKVESSKNYSSRTLLSPTSANQESIRDPNRNHEGMKYCKDGGLWIFPSKCNTCKAKSYAKWSECQHQDTKPPSDDGRRAVNGPDEDDVKNGP